MKINFSPKPSCLVVGVTFVRIQEHRDEGTCEVKKSARDKIFCKRPETTIAFLDFVKPEDVRIISTRNKSYASKGKYDPSCTSYSPSSSSQVVEQATKTPNNQGVPSPLPSSKYNILKQLANIKADFTLLDMVVIPEQQKHLKNFMEGKSSTIANLSKEVK
jgi:hypothetical protein